MNLRTYLARLEDTLRSRQDFMIMELLSDTIATDALFRAHIRFYDNSTLYAAEDLESTGERGIQRLEYAFHYQASDNALIFRYDNSPHYPDLLTFPSHKHTPDGVIAAEPPDLADVLREIDGLLYPL
jgi:hypothetical protein